MTIGDRMADPVPDLASCIDAERARAAGGMVDEALAAGAKKVTREFHVPGDALAAPALLVDVPAHARLARQEVFGPAAGIFRFRDEGGDLPVP
jgi:succinate-semialdehyde dehydrogenase/glutarate-semialdehyde dehydrogenase